MGAACSGDTTSPAAKRAAPCASAASVDTGCDAQTGKRSRAPAKRHSVELVHCHPCLIEKLINERQYQGDVLPRSQRVSLDDIVINIQLGRPWRGNISVNSFIESGSPARFQRKKHDTD
jgi:hypothetical protein